MEKYMNQWRILYKIHEYTKYFILKAEELGYRSYLGPMNELKNAYEHIVRYKTAVIGIQKNKSEDYINKNLDSAIGHEYRAFFDTADWLSLTIRKNILEGLKPYSPKNIREAMPDYYSKVRPRIDEISEEIAGLRQRKDIGNGIDLLPDVEHYEKVLNELLNIYRDISKRVGCIAEFQEDEQLQWRIASEEKKKEQKIQWIRGIVCALVGAGSTYLLLHGQEMYQTVKAFIFEKMSI